MKNKNLQTGNIFVWVLIIIVLALLAAAWLWYDSQQAIAPSAMEPLSDGDTTADIASDFDAIDIGTVLEQDLNKELDADLNNL